MSEKKAKIIIIGNEILSGKITDKNAPYLASGLRDLGVSVERITIIPDHVETISEEIRVSRKRFHLVFVCGGIGPTLDDVTMEGIAKGVGRPLIQDPALLKLLKKTYGPALNTAQTKMANLPEGTKLIFETSLRIPVLHFEHIFIFPGIPSLVVKKFEAIKERFREAPFYLAKLYLRQKEDQISENLNITFSAYPTLRLGSYPVLHQSEDKTLVTLESKDKNVTEAALNHLIDLLPNNAITKVVYDPPKPR